MKRRRRGRSESEQANLFHPKKVGPTWETLPLEIQREVIKLVARMLSTHQACHATSADAEVQHD